MTRRIFMLFTVFVIVNTYSSAQTFIKKFYSITEFVSSGTYSYFVANDGIHGDEIWRTDGTKENTYLIKDINKIGGTSPKGLFVFKNEIYFSANDGVFGQELWKTDGTESGTIMVKDIHSYSNNSSSPSGFTVYQDELYFIAKDYYLNNGYGLWKTDGTASGTVKILDTGSRNISKILVANGKMYLLYNGFHEFNVTTEELTKINIDEFPNIYEVNVLNNDLYFITSDSYYRRNFRLYKFDINHNITLLQEFNEPKYGDIDIHNLTLVGDKVYFSITTDSEVDTDVLWKTDGTLSGTEPVKSFAWRRHLSNSNISDFIEFKSQLYFRSGQSNDSNLWKSDGTESGTIEVFDQSLSGSVDMFIHNDFLYYSNGYKTNLWYTDGTSENRVQFSDLSISTKNSDDAFNITNSNNKIFFEANFQENRALFSNELNPLMEVKKGYGAVQANGEILFETKIDSTDIVEISITNKGNGDLVFSKIEVLGQDFYLDEKFDAYSDSVFPRVLAPKQKKAFNLLFYPGNKGLKKGELKILSNDIVAPEFELSLIGYANAEHGAVPADGVSLKKEIIFDTEEESVVIDNGVISENNSINSPVGTLSVLNVPDDFSYAFIDSVNFSDNQYFAIDKNILKLNTVIDYELKTTYSLKIKATNELGDTFEGVIAVSVEDVYEPPVLEECSLDAKNLGYGLNGVKFLKDQDVIAIGNFGAILKSNDAGNTWRRINTSFKNHLFNIQFVTDNVGYVIGEKIVLKTEDAGETWSKLDIFDDSYPFPKNLFFLNKDFGFVFGSDGKVFKTTDGGRYWKYKRLGFSNLNSAYFLNELKGFIVGNSKTIFTTINGGETWDKTVLEKEGLDYNTNFTSVCFVNDSIGFVSGSRGEILKTNDGGETWELVVKLENQMSVFDLVFQKPDLGYAIGERGLFKTIDGGETWIAENLEYRYSGLQGVDISKDGNRGCVVGHGISCCGGSSTGHIIYTKEFDNEWGVNAYLSLRSSALRAIYFEENHGLVFGGSYGAQTKDGGVTWQDISTPEEYIYQVEVINNNIYLLGLNNIYKSNNSGADWDVLSSSNHFRKLYFISEQTIYGIKSESGVFKTSDGGLNWVEVGPSVDFGLTLNFINEDKGYVGGIDGLYRTIDGGENWTQVITGSPGSTEQLINVFAVDFFNEIGFAGSSEGLLKTTDDGVTWVNINKNLGGVVKFIHALSELKWYVIAGGRVLMTENGGESWETQYYDEEVEDAHFTMDKIYLVGYRHLIEIGEKNEPLVPSFIEGDNFVATQSREVYSVIGDSEDVYYNWVVSGGNEIVARGSKSHVLWKRPGKHTVSVSAYNNCAESVKKELEVTVEDVSFYPSIEGPLEVKEFSLNNTYVTQLNENSRYSWFVEGAQSLSFDKNIVSVDWGLVGDGKVEVVETNVTSGIRQRAVLNVKIADFELSNENFRLGEDVRAYPNPTTGSLEVSLPILKNDVKYEVYTLQSQLIFSSIQRVINGKINLDLSTLSNGMYFVRIYLEGPVTLKILKN